MLKLLVGVDGSECAERAVRHALRLGEVAGGVELVLVNVQPPLSGDITAFVAASNIADFHREHGNRETQSACAEVEASGQPYRLELAVGPIAQTLAEQARKHRVDQIILGSRGHGAIATLVMGATATRVVHLADVPVTLVK